MNRSRTIILAAVLLALLGALAFLQYRWLVRISVSEKEQAQKRLQNDTEHFAADFNQMIQAAYFPFQIPASENWQNDFSARYQNWLDRTELPELIKNFSSVDRRNTKFRYDKSLKRFVADESVEDFEKIRTDFNPIDEKNLILRMPLYLPTDKNSAIRVMSENILPKTADAGNHQIELNRTLKLPETAAYLLIELDADVLKNKVLPDLNEKYFSAGEYQIYVKKTADNTPVFHAQTGENFDAEVKFFELSPEIMSIFVSRDLMTTLGDKEPQSNVVINRTFVKEEQFANDSNAGDAKKSRMRITVANGEKPRIFQSNAAKTGGIWTLDARHVSGSLENSAANALRKNLAVSFGILSLLAVSIGLIYVSAQRAKNFARRQIDFVSSVSHEFRTPLAVIYSAGENLADGVTKEQAQISRYGDLIKSEGHKLSAMVEQILDFAGANAGKNKYDLRETDVSEIVANAVANCRPILAGFTVEIDVGENLPPILADANAITQSIQNLIVNAVKYSGDEKLIKISAENCGGKIKIVVEDKGIGISAKDLKHVLEPFYRAKTVVDEQIHGSGLGLSLVKKTVAAHKGTITAESEIGKGSRFTIQLSVINQQLSKNNDC